jgi:hypothetical protein
MAQRKTIEKELALIHEGRPDGTQLGPPPHATPEYLALMAQVEELNTAMVESVLEAKEISAQDRPTRATDADESSSSVRHEINVPDQRLPRGRRLRESRKTPFRLSPGPRDSNAEDNDFDAILDAQRLEDVQMESSVPDVTPKRKKEAISDTDHRLRKERTDNLVEGLQQVRAVVVDGQQDMPVHPHSRPPTSPTHYPGIQRGCIVASFVIIVERQSVPRYDQLA